MNQLALSIAVHTTISDMYSTVSKCAPSGSIVPFILVFLKLPISLVVTGSASVV